MNTQSNSEALPPTSGSASSVSGLRWHKLTAISRDGEGEIEVMGATCIDGIGVIVRWEKNCEGWEARAIDTEGGEWDYVDQSDESNEIPVEPPTEWDDMPVVRGWIDPHAGHPEIKLDFETPAYTPPRYVCGVCKGNPCACARRMALPNETSPSVGENEKAKDDHDQ